jgi:hypothetical protein
MTEKLIKSLILLIGTLAFAAAIAGCGGGDSGSESTTAAGASETTEGGAQATTNSQEAAPQGSKESRSGEQTRPNEAAKPAKPNEASPPQAAEPPSTSKPKPKPASPPKSAFAKQATKICTQEKKRTLAKLGSYLKKQGTELRELKALAKAEIEIIAPAVEAQVRTLRALNPPSADKQKVAAFLNAQQAAAERDRRNPPSSGTEIRLSFHAAGNLARAAGLAACAYG